MRHSHDPDVLSLALAEPSRRALLETLRFGQKSVTELVHATQLKQPNVSNHLAKMRQQGIVRAERIGRQVYYSLGTPFADVLLRMHEVAASSQPLSVTGMDGLSPARGNVEEVEIDANSGSAAVHGAQASRDVVSGQVLEEWRQAYFESILSGREDQATALVNGMLSRRMNMQTIYVDVFQVCINRVGEHFQLGITDAAHEHLASAITERQMARVAQFFTPVTRLARRALLGCVASNWHILGLRMLADGLRSAGWESLFLGANVPTSSFVTMVEAMRPDLVVISTATDDQAEDLQALLGHLRRLRTHGECSRFGMAIGGYYVKNNPEAVTMEHEDFSAPDMPRFLEIVHARFPPDSKHLNF